jgi:iron complex transport system substrate-binding protein
MKPTLVILTMMAFALGAAALVAILGHRQDPVQTGVAVTDMTGRKAVVPDHAVRILSLCTTATDTLVALAAADRLDSIDEFSRVVPGTEHAAVIGKGSAISREQVVARRIDLAFVWWYQDDAAKMLEEAGVPVVRIKSGRAAELPGAIRLVGQCVGRSMQAEPLVTRIESYLRTPTTTTARPRVFIELYGPYKTAGGDSYTHDVLTLAGGTNVAAEMKGSAVFSAERLVQTDPDAILFVGDASGAEAITRRPGLSGLRAVRDGHVWPVDRYRLVAGPNLPESVEKLRKLFLAVEPKPLNP